MSAPNGDPLRRSDADELAQRLGPILAGSVLSIDAARRSFAADPAHADELLARAVENITAALSQMRSPRGSLG